MLALHLLRFNSFGKKINAFIPFDFELTLFDVEYELFGIVEHLGHSLTFGHYISYVLNAQNVWLRMNDSSVSVVNKNSVSRVHPYMLLYRRKVQKVAIEERVKLRKNSLNR